MIDQWDEDKDWQLDLATQKSLVMGMIFGSWSFIKAELRHWEENRGCQYGQVRSLLQKRTNKGVVIDRGNG